MRIGFCDDDSSVLGEFVRFLNEYTSRCDQEITWSAFSSPLELMAAVDRGERYDVLFLDIIMPGENGINIAKEIRQKDNCVKIVFHTVSEEYAVQSYSVKAYDYLLKPLCQERFVKLMDTLLAECEKEYSRSLLLRCKDGITRVEPEKIEFCEVVHRTLFLHMSNGEVLESIGSLEDLSRQLAVYGCFLRTHRSYLINLNYIHKISYHCITMSRQTEIPVPRGKYAQIKDSFLEYACRNKQVMI